MINVPKYIKKPMVPRLQRMAYIQSKDGKTVPAFVVLISSNAKTVVFQRSKTVLNVFGKRVPVPMGGHFTRHWGKHKFDIMPENVILLS